MNQTNAAKERHFIAEKINACLRFHYDVGGSGRGGCVSAEARVTDVLIEW
jgi:hypothetical protein